MKFLRALTIGTRRGRIATVADLASAVGMGAAYLAQGASYSYIRARSGMVAPRLMEDAAFGEAMDRCKWEGFAAAAGDLALIAEGDMRRHAAVPAAFWQRLYREVLAAEPVPPHRVAPGPAGQEPAGHDPAGHDSGGHNSAGHDSGEPGWDDRIAEFDARLARHLAGPPAGIEDIAAFSASVIVEYAPVDEIIREVDREMVVNNVKFRFIDHVTDLRRRTDWPALAAAVRAAAQPAGEGLAEPRR